MRLQRAVDAGLGLGARVVVFHPRSELDDVFDDPPHVVTPNFMLTQTLRSRGVVVSTQPDGQYDTAIVCVPRSKPLARDLIARACRCASKIVVDGQKNDGVDSLIKAVRQQVDIEGEISKSHGRLFWFASTDLSDWQDTPRVVDGFHTRAGVFSAHKIDTASRLLLAHLPGDLAGDVADFGAGWGYLSDGILRRSGVSRLTLIEADHRALECAKLHINAQKARFIWGDATQPHGRFDAVVMNPPFHDGRADRPELGQAFIRAAARALPDGGELWMVANRHLPYEHALSQCFATVNHHVTAQGFKVISASRAWIR